MRVLYVSSDVSDIHLNLLSALEKNGVENWLATYTLSRGQQESNQAQKTWYYKSRSRFKGPFLYLSRLNVAANFFINKIKDSHLDLLHANMLFGDGYVCRKVFRKLNIPYVLSIRNTDMNLWFLWKLPWIRRAGFKNLVEAKAIIFLSESYRLALLNRLPEKIRNSVAPKCFVIPNGINDFWFENCADRNKSIKDKITFVTAGRIEDNKNQVMVAQALDRYQKVYKTKMEYLIVGDCQNEKMLSQLQKYDFVRILPFQNKEELISTFRKSDIYIMASHTETFGLVYAEALTQGLPVIYTRGQGFDKQFDEGVVGYSVDSKDVNDIFNGIENTVLHFNDLSENAYINCRKFKWDNICNAIKNVYLSSIG